MRKGNKKRLPLCNNCLHASYECHNPTAKRPSFSSLQAFCPPNHLKQCLWTLIPVYIKSFLAVCFDVQPVYFYAFTNSFFIIFLLIIQHFINLNQRKYPLESDRLPLNIFHPIWSTSWRIWLPQFNLFSDHVTACSSLGFRRLKVDYP